MTCRHACPGYRHGPCIQQAGQTSRIQDSEPGAYLEVEAVKAVEHAVVGVHVKGVNMHDASSKQRIPRQSETQILGHTLRLKRSNQWNMLLSACMSRVSTWTMHPAGSAYLKDPRTWGIP